MLRSIDEILGYSIAAADGEVGKVSDFYFDEDSWDIRYLVVDTGSWLPGKKVVISPAGFHGKPDWTSRTFPVVLTCEMVRNWHSIDTAKPISKEMRDNFAAYYAWPIYYSGAYPEYIPYRDMLVKMRLVREEESESNLRSIKEVKGYTIHAKDGSLGHVDDFIIDDSDYSIANIAIDTRDWLPGKHVLIPRDKVTSIHWTDNAVSIDLTKEEIKKQYQYDPHEPINQSTSGEAYDFRGEPQS